MNFWNGSILFNVTKTKMKNIFFCGWGGEGGTYCNFRRFLQWSHLCRNRGILSVLYNMCHHSYMGYHYTTLQQKVYNKVYEYNFVILCLNIKFQQPEDEQSILFETSRPNQFFSEPPHLKFTVHIYIIFIYSYSYSPHHAKLQTPFNSLV